MFIFLASCHRSSETITVAGNIQQPCQWYTTQSCHPERSCTCYHPPKECWWRRPSTNRSASLSLESQVLTLELPGAGINLIAGFAGLIPAQRCVCVFSTWGFGQFPHCFGNNQPQRRLGGFDELRAVNKNTFNWIKGNNTQTEKIKLYKWKYK